MPFTKENVGKVIDLRNGKKARINPETQMLELSDGRTLPLSEKYKREFFPSNPEDEAVSSEKAKIREGVGNNPVMKGLYQGLETFSPTHGGIDVVNKLISSGKEYEAKKRARGELSEEYSETNPYASAAGKIGGIAADVAITRKLPGVKSLPLMTATHKGSELFTNPQESIKDIGIAAAEGKVGDVIFGALGKAAARRGAMRNQTAAEERVAAQNIAGEEATKASNATGKVNATQAKHAWEVDKANIDAAHDLQMAQRENQIIGGKNQNIFAKHQVDVENDLRYQNYQRDVNQKKILEHDLNLRRQAKVEKRDRIVKDLKDDFNPKELKRKNEIVREKNRVDKEKSQRGADKERIDQEHEKNMATFKLQQETDKRAYEQAVEGVDNEISTINSEYATAKKDYDTFFKALPQHEKASKEAYSKEVLRNVNSIERVMSKDDRIFSAQINPAEFIENVVAPSHRAASKQANQAEKFIHSLFPENAILNRQDLIKRYHSLEKKIVNSDPETAAILTEFKDYLGNKIPTLMVDTVAKRKIIPKIQRETEKIVGKLSKEAKLSPQALDLAEINLRNAFREITPENFVANYESGLLKQKLINEIFDHEVFQTIKSEFRKFANNQSIRVSKRTFRGESIEDVLTSLNAYDRAKVEALDSTKSLLSDELDAVFKKYNYDIRIAKADIDKRLGNFAEKTAGMGGEVKLPNEPVARQYPNYPERPVPGVAPEKAAYPEQVSPMRTPSNVPYPELPPEVPGINKPEPSELPSYLNYPRPPIEPPKPIHPGYPEKPAPFLEQQFNPQAPTPPLSAPQGIGERLGQGLENLKFGDILKTKGALDNPLVKLAGLKFLLGKAALPVEAAAAGGIGLLKGLTSPTSLGQSVRQSVHKMGLPGLYKGFDEWARQKYPSYQNGVLVDPNDRFMAAHDVEVDTSLEPEEKATLQRKINRGEPLVR